jgi:hypothetical protein
MLLYIIDPRTEDDTSFNPEDFLRQLSGGPTNPTRQSANPTRQSKPSRPARSSYFYTNTKPNVAEAMNRNHTKSQTAGEILNETDDLMQYMGVIAADETDTLSANAQASNALWNLVGPGRDTQDLRDRTTAFKNTLIEQLTARGEDVDDAKA